MYLAVLKIKIFSFVMVIFLMGCPNLFVYARGRAVLWAANKEICAAGDWQKAVLMQEVNKISIANPETAPYGAAVITALKITGMEEVIKKRLVFAQDVFVKRQPTHYYL